MSESPFEGRLVRLRAREPEDEVNNHLWFNDPEVTEHLALRYPISHRGGRQFLDDASTVGYSRASFAIETLEGARHSAAATSTKPARRTVPRVSASLSETKRSGTAATAPTRCEPSAASASK